MMMYHNSTESTQPELAEYRAAAASQEVKVLAAFLENPSAPATPSMVLSWVFNGSVPITSVRRALTNLTNSGDLVKTEFQVAGPYGRPEFIWELADKYKQQEMF